MASYYSKTGLYQHGDLYGIPRFTLSWYNLAEIKEYLNSLKKTYNFYENKAQYINNDKNPIVSSMGIYLCDVSRYNKNLEISNLFGQNYIDEIDKCSVWTLKSCQSQIRIKITYEPKSKNGRMKSTILGMVHTIFKRLYNYCFNYSPYMYKRRVPYYIKYQYIKLGCGKIRNYKSRRITYLFI